MRLRVIVPALAALVMVSSLAFLVLARPARVADHSAHGGAPSHLNMTDAAMKEWSESWWASHPRVGASSGVPPAATFTVGNFVFDHDGNAATQVDTARILVGESVLWQWVGGLHTITNGSGGGDPEAGTLFDQPSDTNNQQFNFVFSTAGTFPFFCRPHEILQMKGVVIVSTTTGVGPIPGAPLGFTTSPAPNPARTGVAFGFAMRRAGRARAEIFDAGGRRVAVALDRDLDAGPHIGTWDGRVSGGAAARPGLYYVRLRLPAYAGSRAVVIAR